MDGGSPAQGAAGVSTCTKPLLTIRLLGHMKAESIYGRNVLPKGRKARALIALLCLREDGRLPRSRIAGLLWDRSGEAQSRSSLRQALHELTLALSPHAPSLVEVDRDTIALALDKCRVDVRELIDAVDRGEHDMSGHHCDPAETLLEDMEGVSAAFDHWLAAERARLTRTLRLRLEKRLQDALDGGPPAELLGASRQFLAFDPTHEPAIRHAMKALIALGDRAQAVREYERGRSALKRLLDLSPSRETEALYEAVKRMPQTSRPDAVPLPASPLAPTALPRRVAGEIRGYDGQPSVAVLPFETQPEDRQGETLAEGLIDDLVEAISRMPNVFVISRLSSRIFRDRPESLQEIGETLGATYVLSGRLTTALDRVRIVVELCDTNTGAAFWIAKFNERTGDTFALQDKISDAVVSRLAPQLHSNELRRSQRKRPETLQAYDHFLRAVNSMHNSSRAIFDASAGLFDTAIALDPHYAAALAWRAYWHVLRVGQGWSPDAAADAEAAERYVQQALDANFMEPMALAVHGHVAAYLHKDFELAFRRFERALSINPSAAPAWLWSAAAHAWQGNGPQAIEQIGRAMALTPFDPLRYAYSGIAGMSFLADRQYDQAVQYGRQCVQENPSYTHAYRLLAIAAILSGRVAEARDAVRQLRRLEPGLTVERFRRRYPGNGSDHCGLYCEALARAGLPVR